MNKTSKAFFTAVIAASVACGSIPVSAAAGSQAAAVTQQQESKVITYAKSLMGTPYKAGGTTVKGFDASGFVQHVYGKYGYKLPRTSKDMYRTGIKTTKPVPGDLVFFDTKNDGKKAVTFVGIYLGNSKFIAVTLSKGVSIQKTTDAYWKSKYMGARKAPVKK
ncbi:C40 family peptidase [Planococcus lenghuensis]|uniref:C40 family peptidase n=1 Tax=Planococcus lenghuensis TaxID=2213202 RepID=UPI001E42D5D2|nr:C40 family peptidase [Planococcus lenghuensis]